MKIQCRSCFAMAVAVIVFGAAGMVHAASVTVNASATIATATITLTKVTDLDFGTIVASGVSNILIDASAGAAVSTVDAGIASITVPGTSGLVNVDSPVDATVNITYEIEDSTTAADKIDDGSGNSIPFTAASMRTYSTGGGTNPGTLALTANTTEPLHIGGLLQIAANQTAAAYSGTITVTVVY